MSEDLSPIETARALCDPIGDVGGRFMLDGATYAAGAELGFAGMDFYFCGRGGVLGPVDAEVVTDEFGFFAPEVVAANWAAGREVLPLEEAAEHFIAQGHEWGRKNLPEDLDGQRLVELVHRVIAASDVATNDGRLMLFQRWRDEPWPEDPRAGALHAIHLMRELRGGAHVAAVREAGIDPHAAVMVRGGQGTAEFFGWGEPHPDVEAVRAQWEAAEAATDEQVATALEGLDGATRAELVALARAAAGR
jgi:hypothetical protein